MLAKTELTKTDEQIAILDSIRDESGNLMINALAGTGKSTLLRMATDEIRSSLVLYLVFNKSAREEAEGKFKGTTTTIKTLNGLGLGVCMKMFPNTVTNPKKCQELLKLAIEDLKGEDRREARNSYFEILSAVGLAKSVGYIPEGKFPNAKRLCTREDLHAKLEEAPSELVAYLVDLILVTSIKAAYAGSVDFNDQIYMPALFGGSFPRYTDILIDEYQDLNPVNHEMLRKLCKGRRHIGVGDPWQSIYAFRGAVQEGMAKGKEAFECAEKTISISFRCPKAIVENARWRVPNYKWLKEGGHVEHLSSLQTGDIADGAAIICRNNAPLFRMAFTLLRVHRSVSVAGSEIGPKIIALLKKIGSEDDKRSDVLIKIEGWRQDKLQTTQSPDTIHDQAECMKVFAEFGKTLGEAIAYAEHLFKSQGTIKLMTGHKAKGLEFDTVYHLDPWIIKDSKGDQEKNLRYVIQTRAKEAYYEINSKDIK